MKQKIVVKVPIMHCDKCRTNALKIAAAAHGVNTVSIEEASKDLVEVIGDGVNSVCLTRVLKKKFGSATIVKVEEVKEAPAVDVKPTPIIPSEISICVQYCPPPCPPLMYCTCEAVCVCECPEPICSIM